MITVFGAIIIALDVVEVFRKRRSFEELKWFFFQQMIVLSVFFGIGYVFSFGPVIYYSMYGEIVFILVHLFRIDQEIVGENRHVMAFLFLLLAIVCGYINLKLNKNLPKIVPWTFSQDDVFYGLAKLARPTFGSWTRYYFIRMMLFCVTCYYSRKYFIEQRWKDRFVSFIKNIYLVFFSALTFEFLFNNLVSKTLLRHLILNMLGVSTNEITQALEIRMTFGWAGVDGFFSEPSYIAVAWFFLLVMCVVKIKGKKDMINMGLCAMMLVACGAQSGLLLLPLWCYAVLTSLFVRKQVRGDFVIKEKIARIFLGCFFLIVFVLFVKWDAIFDKASWLGTLVYEKVSAFIYNKQTGSASSSSGAIRAFGNRVCYNAFSQCPLFGVGLGTTRGYGILPGMLACLGLAGCVSYLLFIHQSFHLQIKKNLFLLAVAIAYSSVFLSVTYIDMPAILLLFYPFTKQIRGKEETS